MPRLSTVASLAFISLTACATPAAVRPPAPVGPVMQPTSGADRGPCVGAALDLDRIVAACTARASERRTPPASVLRVELSPPEVSVRAGERTTLAVRMTNLSAKPLALDVTLGCQVFEATAYFPDKGTLATEEIGEGCDSFGGLCGTGAPVRVLLDPQGTLTKSVTFAASVQRMEREGDLCVPRPAHPLPPGRYQLRVELPFTDPVPGKPHVVTSRKAEGVVVVTP